MTPDLRPEVWKEFLAFVKPMVTPDFAMDRDAWLFAFKVWLKATGKEL